MTDIADDIEVKEEGTGSEAEALADILAWSKDCPEWQRDALRRLCVKGELEDADLDELTVLCKSKGKGSVPIAVDHIPDPEAAATAVNLGAIHGAENVVLVPVAVDSPRRYTGAMNAIDERACGKPGCDNFGKPGLNIVGHGWFVTKSGRRRRYRCTVCGGTLSTNTGTAYRGLRCSRREFDQVASLRVEGVSMSATARVTGHSRTTIARWLERAATAAACFNHRLLRDFDVIELQADELCTFIGSKRRTLWLFATIEVCSRLWAGSVLGRRSHRNTKAAINDVILRGRLVGCPLIATDGFEYYVGVMVALVRGNKCSSRPWPS